MTTSRALAAQLATAFACACTLAACGGSGGDAAPPAPDLTARQVAASALWAAQGALVNVQASHQAQEGQANPAMAGAAEAGASVRPQVALPCATGGTVDVTIGSLIPFTLNAAFAGCGAAVLSVNGALSLTATGFFQGGALLGFDSTARDFEIAVGPLSQRLNGDTHVAITSLAPVTLEASSESLTTESLAAGLVTTSAGLSGLKARVVIDGGTGKVTSTVDVLATGSFIALGQGSLQVQTLQPMVTALGAFVPEAGQLRITRNQREVTTVTIQGDTTLLELDREGDGTVDSTEEITTGDLLALLRQS